MRFNFTGSPVINNGWEYFIVAWSNNVVGGCYLGYQNTGDNEFNNDIEIYNGFPNPWDNASVDSTSEVSIYCVYSEGGWSNSCPSSNNPVPTNSSSGISVNTDFNVSIVDVDGNNTWGNFSCRENADTGSWSNQANGSRVFDLTNPLDYNTEYKIFVNYSDDYGCEVRDFFLFTTEVLFDPWSTSITVSGLSNTTNVTWDGNRETENKIPWCNETGFDYETVVIDIVVNSTHLCDNITFWFANMNNTNDTFELTGDNQLLHVSNDNISFYPLDLDIGSGLSRFADGGWNLWWNTTTANTSANPFSYYGDGTYININCTLYARFRWNVSDNAYYGKYYNLSAGQISASNNSGADSLGTEYVGGELVIFQYVPPADNPPVLSNESPVNGSTSIGRKPDVYVVCTDADSDTMNATWSSNSSGSWKNFSTNTSISSGTNITQPFVNASSYGVTYWFRVNLSDGMGGFDNETYYFTIESNVAVALSNENPSNNSFNNGINLTWNVTMQDPNGDTFNWTIQCSNGNSSNANGASNGSKTLSIAWLDYFTNYSVWVNVTDGNATTNESFNFTTGNITVGNITISSEFPSNGSSNAPIQPYLYLTINHSIGETMNVSWYYGASEGSENTLLGTDANISNSTVDELYFEASSYNTEHFWRVMAWDGEGIWVNETFTFNTSGPSAGPGRNSLWIIGVMFGIFGFIGLFILKENKKNRRYR